MKIWYQTYAPETWTHTAEAVRRYAQKVARPDTTIELHGVEKYAPKMNFSEYIQFMHLPQVIDKALQAEREGYDAFCIGGTLDLGHYYFREVLDIPVAFIFESSMYNACLLARKFGIVAMNDRTLRKQMELARYHGLEQRCVSGAHLGYPIQELLGLEEKDPEKVIQIFTKAAREVIAQGAGAIIPGLGSWGPLFGERDVHDVDGVPIVDITAAVVKTAEMMVDLHRLGVKRSRLGVYSLVSKDDLITARKLYGVE